MRQELHTLLNGYWIGDGKIQTVAQKGEEEPTWTKISPELLIEPVENPVRSIVQAIYTNFETSYLDSTYLQ